VTEHPERSGVVFAAQSKDAAHARALRPSFGFAQDRLFDCVRTQQQPELRSGCLRSVSHLEFLWPQRRAAVTSACLSG
jgi:hypothetical protein